MKKEEWKPYEGWEKLENTTFDYNDGVGILKGLVALIDPNIGITVISKADKSKYLICLVMPGSPKWDKKRDEDVARKKFNFYCESIAKGYYKAGDTANFIGEDDRHANMFGNILSSSRCAFL